MKDLKKNDVLKAANILILANGQTTTLEVKNLLRTDDFYVKQANVSSLVQELVDDDELKITGSNGIYRTYISVHPVDDDDEKSEIISSGTSSSLSEKKDNDPVSTPVITVKHRNGNITPVKPITRLLTKKGDWEVTSTLSSDCMYFLGSLTRDEVRRAFATLELVPFYCTLAKHIK